MRRGRRLASFALFAGLALLAPSSASAERVALLRPVSSAEEPSAEEQLLERVGTMLSAALSALGHAPIEVDQPLPSHPHPAEQVEALRTLAGQTRARWALGAEVAPRRGGYVLTLSVGYFPDGRLEILRFEVPDRREVARLERALRALLRPAGLGREVRDLSGADPEVGPLPRADRASGPGAPGSPTSGATTDPGDGSDGPEDESRTPESTQVRGSDEAAEATIAPPPAPDGAAPGGDGDPASEPPPSSLDPAEARRAWEERERGRRERAERERWEGRERYGVPHPLLLQAGLALRPLARRSEAAEEAVAGALAFRVGWGWARFPGLESRAGVEADFGSSAGFALHGGAVYLWSPFVDAPVHIGLGVELGYLQDFEGVDQAAFLARLAPLASWRFHGQWFLEGAVSELGVLAGGGTAITVGFAARVGYRMGGSSTP